MKAIKIYTKDSKYYMEDLENNSIVELTKIHIDKRKNTEWLVLPENCLGRGSVSKDLVDKKTEVTYEKSIDRCSNGQGTKTTLKSKVNISEHYTDEEKTKVEKLQAQIDKINEAVRARIEKAQKEQELIETAMKLTPEQLKAILAKMEAKA